MGWKATGHPPVRKQRDKWVVRVDGIDTETGRPRPRQLGTYASQRSALAATRSLAVQERVASRDSVSWVVRRYVAARSDVTLKAKEQYEWAIPHIEAGLDPDLPDRAPGGVGRCSRGRLAPAQSCGACSDAEVGGQAAEGEGGQCMGRPSGGSLPGDDQ